ncbi:hypothetical protein SteCoe_4556 [Stentor coeruleus]|uniref:Uncharacterized protein n=1 Tax=Stentor coeruleus TaxID=5963 RepID=A0A1R2CUI1_9CILI|nr:hypothetical protein SteCoe_4556 [Stentor coeruleus]
MDCNRKGCGNKALDWKVCAQCFLVRYCSEECLEEDWDLCHENECEGHVFNIKDLIQQNAVKPQQIGKGTYSEVCLVQHRKTKTFYALKAISKSIISVNLPLQTLFREISLHKSLVHENIVRLYDQLEDQKKIYLVLEYVSKVNLYEYIKCYEKIPENDAVKIFVDICLGIRYMHSKGILHRDLKAENILISEDFRSKICDLGWSTYCDKPRNTFCGTLDYMSPELLNGEMYSFPSDIWSLGILLYEMLHGKMPFDASNESEKLQNIKTKNFFIEPKISQAGRGLLQKILTYDPHKRITLNEILKHRWIQENYDIDCAISLGNKVNHPIHGTGSIVSIKGLICSVNFTNKTLEFSIPELASYITFANENLEESTFDPIRFEVSKDISQSFRHQHFFSASTSKIEESSSSFSSFENGNVTDSMISELIDNQDPLRIYEIQKDLLQLQQELEQPKVCKAVPQRRKTLIDQIFGNS